MPARHGGLYALIALDGAPLDRRDIAALGLGPSARDGPVAAAAVDTITPAATHHLVEGGRTTLLLGWIDDADDVADRLGVARTLPPLLLARAALDRWGMDTPQHLLGSWIMLDHGADGGQVSLLVGIGGCAPLLYAQVGDRLAVAPSIHALSRLGWVGRDLDEEALLASFTIAMPAEADRSRTILRGVRRVARGGCVTIARGRPPSTRIADPFIPVPRWTGSRRDAIAAAEAMLSRIVGERLARSPSPGLLLSGGLDSSLIACMIAVGGGAKLPAFCSAVAPGRGVADETPFAAAVADALGMPLHRVVPSANVNVYRPSIETLAASNIPMLSPRDYVYAAFAETAGSLGVGELFDGAHGELTFTAWPMERTWRGLPRAAARNIRDAWRDRGRPPVDPADAILDVVLASARRASGDATLRALAAADAVTRITPAAGDRLGYSSGALHPLNRDVAEVRAGALRLVRPFHDIRLLRLFAGFPRSILTERGLTGGGLTRWPARALMAGRLPDAIVRRPKGMPFSPDYHLRLVEQAPTAITRLPAFRAAGCDEWFDLNWLAQELALMAADGRRNADAALRLQLTAHACEFLTWWRSGLPPMTRPR